MTVVQLLTLFVGIFAMQTSFAGTVGDDEPVPGPGLNVAEAIEVCDARGQRQYLSMLVCPDRSHPSFKRVGSFGTRDPYPGSLSMEEADEILLRLMGDPSLQPGDPHFHMVDGYEVQCPESSAMIYMDLYHCDQEFPTIVPRGFTLQR